MTHPSPETVPHSWLWLDLETTGLDPLSGHILEIAVVLAADAKGDDFRVIDTFDTVVDHGPALPRVLETMDDFVRDMHTRNELIEELEEASHKPGTAPTIDELDEYLVSLVRDRLHAAPRSIVLAGASVHFDLAWIRVHLPGFAEFLSHRVLDVSALKAFERAHGAPFGGVETLKKDERPHRALADVLFTLGEAREIRDRRWL